MASATKNKLAFLSMPAPASYVAGLGRGASGFTTRSDIGPAREGPSAETIAEAQSRRGEEPEYDQDAYQDPESETGLFNGMVYEADDEEADKIYEAVDAEMDKRRKARREAREEEEHRIALIQRPKIQAQFSDLKRSLSTVTDDEWESLPEASNITKRKKVRETRTFALPDSVLVGNRESTAYENSLDERQQVTGGMDTPVNLSDFRQARDIVLSMKLDQVSGTASNGLSTSIDPKGYLTELDSVIVKNEAEIGDIKRARMLFDSLIKSNPKHAPGWIAAANLEEHAGRLVTARKLIKSGCEHCPKSEDVWLEAARLHSNQDAKVILANAVQHVGHSVQIWLKAAELEGDVTSRKRVFRRALELIPNSVRLWKETVNLESEPADARLLLSRAVEVIPTSVELWLALAHLENPDQAKKVLNKARKAVPTSHEIWIAGARLLEQEAGDAPPEGSKPSQSLELVDKTIELGVKTLKKHQVSLSREQWLEEAEKCESLGFLRTGDAIVKATISMDVDDDARFDVWTSDVASAVSKKRFGTARSILAFALRVYPDRLSLWMQAVEFEQAHGTKETLEAILKQSVQSCPQAEELWLRWAKEMWKIGDVSGAREVLERAFLANPDSEAVWLAAVKLEAENGEYNVARELLTRARTVTNTPRVWMKSVVFERERGDTDSALKLLTSALSQFPTFPKLYMIEGQIHQDLGNLVAARASYAAGLKKCSKTSVLWILASRLEELDGKSIKGRSLLDKARQILPTDESLWAESFYLEKRAGSMTQAKAALTRGIQACPQSALLWSLSIFAEPRPARKGRCADAIRKCGQNAFLQCAGARLFWIEGKVEKARKWFQDAAALSKNSEVIVGDIWGWWLKFERQHGITEQQEIVRADCESAVPSHGRVWQEVAKDPRRTAKTTRDILELVADKLEEDKT